MTIERYLYQFLGFILQLFPACILFFFAFPKEELKTPLKRIMCYTYGLLTIFAIGFCILVKLLYGTDFNVMQIGANIYFGITIILLTVFFFYNVRTGVSKKIFTYTMIAHYMTILYTLVSISQAGIKEDTRTSLMYLPYDFENVLAWIIFTAITFPLFLWFTIHTVKKTLAVNHNDVIRRGCYIVSASLFIYMVCIISLQALTIIIAEMGIDGIYLLLFLLCLIVIEILVYVIFFSEIRLSAERYKLEEQVQIFDLQYKKIKDGIEEARHARHDIRHHLNVISKLHQDGNNQELKEYLALYNAVYEKLEDQPLSSYPAVDNVLKYYIAQAENNGITVQTDIILQQCFDFNIMDMTVLLGNAMENAIEACMDIPLEEERFIAISLRKMKVSLFIQIDNSCSDKTEYRANSTMGHFINSTKQLNRSGIGIKSMTAIAEKYNGSAEFRKKDGVFTSRFVLNFP